MNKIAILAPIVALALGGCLGLGEMKLRDGEAGCDTVTTIYGSAARIVTRADNVSKGATSAGTLDIKCGNADMKATHNIGVPVPAGATTVTTTTVTPVR